MRKFLFLMAFLLGISNAFAQKITVSGTVTDESNNPLLGASITVKGTSRGVSSDFDGNYKIEVEQGDVLEFSFIGFLSQTKSVVGGRAAQVINVILQEDAQQLDDVVVVGYGTQRKESLTGALQTIKNEKLKDVTSPTVANMLNGKVSGVFVAPGSGQPGQAGAVVIRGKSSINGSVAPLWVIDGVIMGSTSGALNPSDIETLTVLKDAASTAIYGSQGANGVILVTTKAPKTGKIQAQLSLRQGITSLNRGNLEMMNGAELYDYFNSFSNASVINFPRWNSDLRNSNYDWWKGATRMGIVRDYSVSMQGGSETLRSYFSLGFYDEEGTVKGYDYNKYDFRYRTEYQPIKWLTIKPSISGTVQTTDDKQHSVTAMYRNLPWDNPYDESGNLVPNFSSLWVNSNSTNYLYDLQWNHSSGKWYQAMGGLDFSVKLTDWLSFNSVNNYRWNGITSSGYADPRSSSAQNVNGRITEYQYNSIRRYTNHILQFDKSFNKHSINALVAYEFNDFWEKTLDVYGTGFIPGFEVLDVVTKPERTKGTINEWAVQSFLSKAVYNYDGKYVLEGSFRRDGASNFGTNAKYGNFFSVSGSWNIHNQAWFKPEWVNLLKLRASYGSVGNRPHVLYPQYDLYAVTTSASYNQISGALISQIGNKDLTWEKTYTAGLGVDATLFNRLSLTVDLYDKTVDNLLYAVPISGLTGVTYLWRNVGELSNRGIEVTLGVDVVKNENFNWNVDFNIGKNTNKVKRLYGNRTEMIVGDGMGIAGSTDKLLKPGLDSDSFYLREWAGVNKDNGAPMWYKTVTDANGNTTRETTSNYAEADQVVVGTATPDFFGGFGTSLSYKNFNLNANFGFSYGGKIYNYSRTEYDSDGAYTDRNQMRLINGWSRWEKPGDEATHPVAAYNNPSNSNKVSSRFLEDGSYLKLRSLSLGYSLDLSQHKLPKLHISITGENLFFITNYSGVDPEIPTNDNGAVLNSAGASQYPSVRKFILGITANF